MSSCAAVSMASAVAGTPAASAAPVVSCPPCWLDESSCTPSSGGSSQGWLIPLGRGIACTTNSAVWRVTLVI